MLISIEIMLLYITFLVLISSLSFGDILRLILIFAYKFVNNKSKYKSKNNW
jgi:hypothetical protein